MTERRLDWTCTCIGLGHDHEPFKCQRQSKIMGGTCQECVYWRFEHPAPKKDEPGEE